MLKQQRYIEAIPLFEVALLDTELGDAELGTIHSISLGKTPIRDDLFSVF